MVYIQNSVLVKWRKEIKLFTIVKKYELMKCSGIIRLHFEVIITATLTGHVLSALINVCCFINLIKNDRNNPSIKKQ